MIDPRIQTLANNIITYSVDLQPGEKVLIENTGYQKELVNALVEEAYKAGGHPFVTIKDNTTQRALLMGATEEQLELQSKFEETIMKEMDAYVGLRSGDNISELSDVPSENMALYQKKVYKSVHHGIRIPKTKWCVLRYPTPSMSQLADMSTTAFENLFFDVCNLDYSKMLEAM